MDDMTAFQRDIVYVVAGLGDPAGVDVKRELDEYYAGGVSDSRLYKNLATLVEDGVLEKGTKDRRTNEYHLTERGYALIERHDRWKRRTLSHARIPTSPAESAVSDHG